VLEHDEEHEREHERRREDPEPNPRDRELADLEVGRRIGRRHLPQIGGPEQTRDVDHHHFDAEGDEQRKE
jgi:hypothetical protein